MDVLKPALGVRHTQKFDLRNVTGLLTTETATVIVRTTNTDGLHSPHVLRAWLRNTLAVL